MSYMRAVVLGCFAVAAGCATAGKDNGNNSGIDASTNGQHDAPNQPNIDGAVTQHDAPAQTDAPPAPTTITLTQTADNTVTIGKSVACGNNNPAPPTLPYTGENSWYRVFSPAQSGITTPFHVTHVDFGVQQADGGAQQVQVKVGTYSGALGTPTLSGTTTPLNSMVVSIPTTTTGEMVTANITADIPASSNFVVELFSPDHSAVGIELYIGASAGTEQQPGYVRAPDCSITTPEKLKTAATAAGSLILTVTGTY